MLTNITELSQAANLAGTDKGTDNLNVSDSMGNDVHYGYTEVYDTYFNEIRQKKDIVYILEIGVFHGKSLQMYNNYFGADHCVIYGLDIDDKSEYNSDNIHTYIVDQSNKEALEQFVALMQANNIKFDIILDDGSHKTQDQLQTLGSFQYIANPGAIYIIEDIYVNFIEYLNNVNGFMYDSAMSFIYTLAYRPYLYDSEYFDLLGRIKYTTLISLPSLVIYKGGYPSYCCNTALIKFK